jgi:hypothetical protein
VRELSVLLQELKVRGAVIEVHADRLRVRPPTALTPDILEALRQPELDIIRTHTARGNSSRFPGTPAEKVESVTAKDGNPGADCAGPRLDGSGGDLPVAGRGTPARVWCPIYRHRTAWRSVFGPHLICAACHPPAIPRVVAKWLDHGDESR